MLRVHTDVCLVIVTELNLQVNKETITVNTFTMQPDETAEMFGVTVRNQKSIQRKNELEDVLRSTYGDYSVFLRTELLLLLAFRGNEFRKEKTEIRRKISAPNL